GEMALQAVIRVRADVRQAPTIEESRPPESSSSRDPSVSAMACTTEVVTLWIVCAAAVGSHCSFLEVTKLHGDQIRSVRVVPLETVSMHPGSSSLMPARPVREIFM